MSLYKIREIAGIYVDAYVVNDLNQLLFMSVWGLDTAIQEFIAKLTIPSWKGGLSDFQVQPTHSSTVDNQHSSWKRVFHTDQLVKLTGRVAKSTLFNQLVQVWIHDPLATQIDYSNRRTLLLKQHTEDPEIFSQRLWHTVQSVCSAPLLPEWRHILEYFQKKNWIKHYTGIHVDAYCLDFSNTEIDGCIKTWIDSDILTLPKKESHLSLVK